MALEKLRVELRETIKQSRSMAESVDEALMLLMDETQDLTEVRSQICNKIIIGLQAQDRLEQRCKNIEQIIDVLSENKNLQSADAKAVWSNLSLDELSKPELSGKGAAHSGEIEFF